MSNPLVIPRPLSLRWRDAATRLGPALVFVAAAAVVAMLWRTELLPSGFVGEAQSKFSIVTAPQAGRLVDLQVEPYILVTNGQILARVDARSPDSIRAMLDALTTELEVMRVRMLQDQERNDLNRAQLRHELLLQRLELAGARIRLRQAESEFERARKLYDAQVLAAGIGLDEDGYEVALRDRDLAQAEVDDKGKLIEAMEETLSQLGAGPEGDRLQPIQTAIERAIEAQERQLRALEGPSVIRAPIDGMVMRLYRGQGENVSAEEQLFEIRGARPQWIQGFIRQPITFHPKPGDRVRVVSRGRPRREAETTVRRVGAHLEAFSQPLRVRGFDASLERGLPVLLDYPAALGLQPGELVDLIPLSR